MTGRDDSVLYSAMTSASVAKQAVAKKERLEEKKDKRRALDPVGEILKAEFQKEIDALRNIDYLNIEDMLTDEHFKAELMARKKTIEKLQAIQTRLNNILRVPEPKKVADEAE